MPSIRPQILGPISRSLFDSATGLPKGFRLTDSDREGSTITETYTNRQLPDLEIIRTTTAQGNVASVELSYVQNGEELRRTTVEVTRFRDGDFVTIEETGQDLTTRAEILLDRKGNLEELTSVTVLEDGGELRSRIVPHDGKLDATFTHIEPDGDTSTYRQTFDVPDGNKGRIKLNLGDVLDRIDEFAEALPESPEEPPPTPPTYAKFDLFSDTLIYNGNNPPTSEINFRYVEQSIGGETYEVYVSLAGPASSVRVEPSDGQIGGGLNSTPIYVGTENGGDVYSYISLSALYAGGSEDPSVLQQAAPQETISLPDGSVYAFPDYVWIAL